MSKITELNERLEDDIQELDIQITTSSSIKDKIEEIAENKNISINYGTDTPLDVLDNIDNGTITTPTGNINITNTQQTDVSNYATAQVVDNNLIPENVKDGVTILGITGTLSGGGAIIRTAELPNTTITLSQNGTTIESKSTGENGGVVDFTVSTIGTYTVGNGTWSNTVNVTELNTVNLVKAGTLANYSEAQIHTACAGGYAHIMWSPKDTWTFPTIAGSIYSGAKIMIADFISQNGVDKIIWIASDRIGTANYDMYPQFYYLSNATANSWSSNYLSLGGFKYSAMRQRMMESGEEIYSQATGVLPDDYAGTLTDGIKFSEFYYTNGNGAKSSLYSYSYANDDFTVLATLTYSSTARFVKGYFTSVGAIDETTFNSGYYYTYANGRYTRATTYTSGTTYYGFYETLQADGIFLAGIKLTGFANYLVKQQRYASAGGTQTTSLSSFTDYISLPAIEEVTGLNRRKTLPSGQSATNAGAYNLAGEGTKQAGFDFDTKMIGSSYGSRSTYSNNNFGFCRINPDGAISLNYVYSTSAMRLSFITE